MTNETIAHKNRIEFIDLAKGICIILLLINHAHISLPLMDYLRMPFYFLVSGIFFKSYGSLINLAKKKTNKLVIPFIFFYILAYLILVPYNELFDAHFLQDHPKDYWKAHSFLTDIPRTGYLNNPIWFLLCLFWCNILYYFASLKDKVFFKTIVVAAYTCIGLVLWHCEIFIPFHLSTALVAMPYFHIGSILKKSPLLRPTKYDKYGIAIAVAICCILLLIYPLHITASVMWFQNTITGSVLVFYIISFIMVIAALLFCKQVKHLPIVSYLGRYSIIILGTHWIFILIGLDVAAGITENFFVEAFITFCIAMPLSSLCIPFLKEYLPYFTAQKDILQ